MARDLRHEALRKIPKTHALYRSFFHFADGPPTTAFELNGWGDDLVHDYLKAIEIDGRMACSTATRTTAASGTTTGATSAGWRRTTPGSRVNMVMYALTA